MNRTRGYREYNQKEKTEMNGTLGHEIHMDKDRKANQAMM